MVSQVNFEASRQPVDDASRSSGSGRGERLIFVGGAPRSGTTLVQNMLDCHGQIYGGPEFLHIPDIMRVRALLRASVARKWIDLYCSFEQVDEATASLVEGFLLPRADAEGLRFVSEKSPMNVLAFPEMIELFPKARFIFVVRDPRAIVSSLLEVGTKARSKGMKPPHFTRSVSAAIAYTRECMAKGFKTLSAAPERCHLVVYESLVAEPEAQARALCDFLEIPWEQSMLRPASKKHAGEHAITVNSDELWYDAKAYYKDPEVDRIDRWKQVLSAVDQVAITRLFQGVEELNSVGYDFSAQAYSPVARFLGEQKSYWFRFQQRLSRKLAQYLKGLQILSA